MRARPGFVFAAAVLTAAGCSGEFKTYPVRGSVTYQNKPVDDGVITFEPQDVTNFPKRVATITGGTFETLPKEGLAAGNYVVRITAVDPASKMTGPIERDADGIIIGYKPPRELLPQKYNLKSELKTEVRAAGPHEMDFKLD